MSKLRAAKARVRSFTGRTSLSDHSAYRTFCVTAAADDEVFRTFRGTSSPYTDILEHVPDSLALAYADQLRLAETGSPAELDLAVNDDVGFPRKIRVPGVGLATGSGLRYLSVARAISGALEPSLECHFLEVGVGYGGQVRVLSAIFPRARFTLVDLPETLALARRFLQSTGIEARIDYVAASSSRAIESDVFISNYAFSELRRDVQEKYMRDLVLNAKGGYVTWNSISPRSFRSLTAEKFSARVGGNVSPETPLSFPGNQVVLWRE